MRKISRKDDNPIENIILDVGDKLLPFFKRTGHTPNMLTTYSFILGIAAVYFLYNNQLFNFAICFYTSYIFDCWDGYMARTYNITSEFGDLYDHFTDISVGLALAYVAYNKFKHKITFNLLLIVGIMTCMMQMHVSCYQKEYMENNKKEGKEKETLDSLTCICPGTEYLPITRFFGPATYILFIIALMYYLTNI